MTHVFSLEAIATCEQRGHAFAWVETWHGIGFDECRRCGFSGATRERSAGILPGATVDAPTYDWDSVRKHEAGQWCAATERDLANLAKPGGVVFVAPPSRQAAAAPAPRYAAATEPAAMSSFAPSIEVAKPDLAPPRPRPAVAGRMNRNAARDDQIRARVAAGESQRSIAQAFGLHQSRVTQILRGGRAPKARPEDTARNAEIRRRMASGESVKSIATAFGISAARVYQIAPARSTGGD